MQLAPSPSLSSLVKHFLVIDYQALREATYRFFPDGKPGLVFAYADPIVDAGHHQPRTTPFHNFVYGQANHYVNLQAGCKIGLLIVVFQPWGLHCLSNVAGSETTNQQLPLEDLFGSSATTLQTQLLDCSTTAERIQRVEHFLLTRRWRINHNVAFVQRAFDLLHQTTGKESVRYLTQQLHTTERSLERRFNEVIGLSPKQAARILRLLNSLKVQQQQPALSLTQVAYGAGYYDQAHFIRDFTQLTGLTPGQYLANSARLAVNLMPIPM